MLRRVWVLVLFLIPVALAGGQPPAGAPAAQPGPAAAPPPALRVEQVLMAATRLLETAREASKRGDAAVAQQALGEAQKALQLIEGELARNIDGQLLAGEVAAEAGNQNDARKWFKAVLELEPNNFRANLGLGRYYILTRLWRQAQGYLANAERVAPEAQKAEVLRLLAVAFGGMHKRNEAVATAERALAADPQSVDSARLLVNLYADAQNYERAIATARSLIQNALREYQAAPAEMWRLQNLIGAHQMFVEVLKRQHNEFYRRDARNQFTDQLLPGREAEAARVLYELARQSAEISARQVEAGHHEKLMLVVKAVEYQPENTRYLLDLGSLYEATHQPGRAIETYQRVLAVQTPSDDPAEARVNQEQARQALERLGVAASQPASGPAVDLR